jgi:hypothetical protein
MASINGTFPTPAGECEFAITNFGHVYIKGKQLTINRVEYSSVTLHLYLDCGWGVHSAYQDLYMSRDGKSASPAARAKAETVLGAAWREFIKDKRELLAQAGHKDAEATIRRAEEKIEELQAEINKQQCEIIVARDTIKRLQAAAS